MISAIIPTLNEELEIGRTIDALLSQAGSIEVIVADGGSTDGTVRIAESRGAAVLVTRPNRGVQLHAGALAAAGDILWFVHADTRPCQNVTEQIQDSLRSSFVAGGNFTLVFDGRSPGARILNASQPLMQWLGVYYGDSTIFVRRSTYFGVGGFQPLPLFEDKDLIQKIKAAGRFISLPAKVTTSSRRLEEKGFVRTCLRWSTLQCLHWLGVPAERLADLYGPIRRRRP